ncbi:MAG: hypothetical protein H6719_13805 [Sandaracinaceae bacterium]|nr:hypothetical protein [Sandaracinaceae bacterium]
MRGRRIGAIGLAVALAAALAGCREITIDPAGAQRAPLLEAVEETDAQVDEDAAAPPGPIPDWALEDPPPPAFPPPE